MHGQNTVTVSHKKPTQTVSILVRSFENVTTITCATQTGGHNGMGCRAHFKLCQMMRGGSRALSQCLPHLSTIQGFSYSKWERGLCKLLGLVTPCGIVTQMAWQQNPGAPTPGCRTVPAVSFPGQVSTWREAKGIWEMLQRLEQRPNAQVYCQGSPAAQMKGLSRASGGQPLWVRKHLLPTPFPSLILGSFTACSSRIGLCWRVRCSMAGPWSTARQSWN